MPEFGTSGLRGLASDLTDELCATYAAAFVSSHGHNGRLFLGRDWRDSSPRIARAVAAGAASQGVEVVDCGVLPTPALAYAALAEGTLSITVTGSHIPADRNGLKFYTGQGEFTKADEAPLKSAVARWTAPITGDVDAVQFDATAGYVARYVDGLPSGILEGQRIGVWLHSSAASEALPAILTGLGADVMPLGASDSFVPVDTEAIGPETRTKLKAWVKEHALDALVSTDGDADRPLLIDDTGEVVPGDILGPVAARWLRADTVVTTVSANTMVDLMAAFPSVTRTKIGSPHVIAAMEERMIAGAERVVGYEPNGGFLLGWDVANHDFESGGAFRKKETRLPKLMTRDSALPLLAAFAAMAEAGGTLSELVARLPERRTATDRLQDIPRAASLSLVDAICGGDRSVLPAEFGALEAMDGTDGVRMTFVSGRILHIRPSGNAPELRCYVEAESKSAADTLLKKALQSLREAVT